LLAETDEQTKLRTSPPTSADGIEKYLSSGMIRGVGPVYANKLVRAFGEKGRRTHSTSTARLQRNGRNIQTRRSARRKSDAQRPFAAMAGAPREKVKNNPMQGRSVKIHAAS
jgi:hypothetical protein